MGKAELGVSSDERKTRDTRELSICRRWAPQGCFTGLWAPVIPGLPSPLLWEWRAARRQVDSHTRAFLFLFLIGGGGNRFCFLFFPVD